MKTATVVLLYCLFTLLVSKPAFAAVTNTITSSPSSVVIGEEFGVSFTASGLTNDTQYYGKIRLGTGSSYTKGETKNGNEWLSDTDAWTSFPTFTSDGSGSLNDTLTGRAKSTTDLGTNQLYVRLRKVGDSNNVSPDGETTITIAEAPTPTPTPSPTPTPTPTSSPASTPTNTPAPTNTPTPTQASSQTTTVKPTPTPTKVPTPSPRLEGDVLAKQTANKPLLPLEAPIASASPTPTTLVAGFFQENLPKFFIIGGGLLFLAAIGLFYFTEGQKKGIFDEAEGGNN